MKVLELPLVAAIRQNHALEHATIHVLSEGHPNLRLVGRSDWKGFALYGPVSTQEVDAAVSLALRRLQEGESQLAVHAQCGTNVAAGVLLAAVAVGGALLGQRSRFRRALGMASGLVAAAVLALPVGMWLQEEVTTSADVTGLQVARLSRHELGGWVAHRVETKRA